MQTVRTGKVVAEAGETEEMGETRGSVAARVSVNRVFSDLLLSHAAHRKQHCWAIRAGLTVKARPQRYVLRTGLAYVAVMRSRDHWRAPVHANYLVQ